MADFQLNVKLNGVETAVSTVGELEQALRATKAELKGAEYGGEQFQQLSEQARILQRELREVKEATNFDRNLGQLGESVSRLGSSVSAAFAISTSAISLFGDKSEELSKAQLKAQQSLAIALGATTIAANAAKLTQDLKNISDALGLNLTKSKIAATTQETAAEVANTAATTANTAATSAQAAATGAATVAQEGLNAAMKANPVGLLIAGLTALVGALVLFSSNEEKTQKSIISTNSALIEQSKLLNKQTNDFITAYKAKRELDILSLNSDKEREEARKKLAKEILDIQLSALKTQEKALAETNKNNLIEIEKFNKEYQLLLKEEQVATDTYRVKTAEGYDTRIKWSKKLINVTAEEQEAVRKKFEQELIEQTKDLKDKELIAIKKAQIETQYQLSILDIQKKALEEQGKFEDKNIKERFDNLVNSVKATREELERIYTSISVIADEESSKQKKIDNDLLDKKKDEWKKAYDKIKENLKSFYNDVQRIEDDYRKKLFDLQNENNPEARAKMERDIEVKKIQDIQALRLVDIENYKLGEKEREKINRESKEAIDAIDAYYSQLSINRKIEADKKKSESDAKYAQIKAILNEEISFGDQNLFDTKKALVIKQQELELEIFKSGFQYVLEEEKMVLKERKQNYIDYLIQIKEKSDGIAKLKLEEDIRNAKAEAIQREENFKETISKEISNEKQRAELLADFRKNNEEQLNSDLKLINDRYNLERAESAKRTEDEIYAYRVQKTQEYSQVALGAANTLVSLLSEINDGARQDELQKINAQYSAEQDALNDKFNAGLISRKEYDEKNFELDRNRRKVEYDYKKKAFEEDKKLRIAQTIIAGLSGALQAFAGAMQLGPIAGPIVGSILASLVTSMTAVQVANIKKQQFDDGNVDVTPINPGSNTNPSSGNGSVNTGSSDVSTASSGGFTGFTPNLVNNVISGSSSGSGGNGGGSGPIKVVVLESDITNAQNNVRVYESNATFG
jgi:hypothetical protein